VLAHPAVRSKILAGLAELKAHSSGSSTFAPHALLLALAPQIDASEITDKGYINQSAVLKNRAELVEALYAGGAEVMSV
jgi:feruloyl-CoA synthase